MVGGASMPVTALAGSVAGGRLACGLWSGGVGVWDARARGTAGMDVLVRHQRAVTAIVPLDEHTLATASQDSFANVWDVRAPAAPLCTVTLDRAPVLAAVHIPGTQALALSTPRALHRLDTATGAHTPLARATAPGFGSLLWNAAAGSLYACSQSSISVFVPLHHT